MLALTSHCVWCRLCRAATSGTQSMATVLRFDGFEVDLAAGRLFKRGARIRLREQSFQVLATLLERPGEVVTREDLRRRLWPTDVFIDFENSLNAAVARLREALGDSADRPRFIETLPKRGYRFIGAIGAPVPSPGPAETRRKRLLVLPFVNLSGDAAQEYLNDAITDEMITELASVAPDALAVIARTTAMRYKGAQKDVARMGRELNVDYVLEGAARRADDQVQLTVQLIRARDQTHIFAKRYDAPMRDLFATERASAQEVAQQLDVLPAAIAGAGPVGVGHPRQPPTCDPEAYTRYAQGRYRLYRTHDEIAKAKELLEDAIRLAPPVRPGLRGRRRTLLVCRLHRAHGSARRVLEGPVPRRPRRGNRQRAGRDARVAGAVPPAAGLRLGRGRSRDALCAGAQPGLAPRQAPVRDKRADAARPSGRCHRGGRARARAGSTVLLDAHVDGGPPVPCAPAGACHRRRTNGARVGSHVRGNSHERGSRLLSGRPVRPGHRLASRSGETDSSAIHAGLARPRAGVERRRAGGPTPARPIPRNGRTGIRAA